jgi:hypothetical protein
VGINLTFLSLVRDERDTEELDGLLFFFLFFFFFHFSFITDGLLHRNFA